MNNIFNRLVWTIILCCTSVLLIGAKPSKGAKESERKKGHIIMFYNVENFFDTEDDPNTLDDEFTPAGPKEWSAVKYEKKLSNISYVIYSVASANRNFPAIIGVSEIENRRVLDDIVSTEKLSKANYQIVHYDSPEIRGVDVALLYRPDVFEFEWSDAFQPIIPERPGFKTRDILAVCGRIEGELFCFFVNHWSSRRGGSEASEFLRCGAAQTLRNYTDSLQRVYPDINIVIMGDMNDDPYNRSLSEILGAQKSIKNVKPNGFFNPFWEMLEAGYGSIGYQDEWSLFDNIVVNSNLTDVDSEESMKIYKGAKDRYYGTVFKRKFLIQQKGKYKNYPLRTYSGNSFVGGYSDHLPVYIEVGK